MKLNMKMHPTSEIHPIHYFDSVLGESHPSDVFFMFHFMFSFHVPYQASSAVATESCLDFKKKKI